MTSRMTVVATFVAATAAAVACGSTYAEDTPRVPNDGGLAPDDGAPPPLQCGDPGSQCVVVPSGWLVVAPRGVVSSAPDGGLAPEQCPAYYTEPRVLVGEPAVASTTCDCTCGAPTTSSCSSGTVVVELDGNGSVCGDNTRSLMANGGACRALPSWNPDYTGAKASPPGPVDVPCHATAKPPSFTFPDRLGVCTSPPPAPCAGGACVAVAQDQRVCVLRDGEHECPAGYPARSLYVPLDSIADKRSCSPCICTGKATSCTAPKLTLFSDAACTIGGVNVALDGVCNQNAALDRTHFEYTATDVGLACSRLGALPEVVGAIETGGKQTMCCASP